MSKQEDQGVEKTLETLNKIYVAKTSEGSLSESDQQKVLDKIDSQLGDQKVDLDPEEFPEIIKRIMDHGNELGKSGARASAILSGFLTNIRHKKGKEIWKETTEKLGLPQGNLWESWIVCPNWKTLKSKDEGFPHLGMSSTGLLDGLDKPDNYNPAQEVLKGYDIDLKDIFKGINRIKSDNLDDPIKPNPEKNPLDRENLPFISSHLPGFKYVDRGLRLQGEEYKIIKKAIWYQIFSMASRKTRVELGDVYHDLRVHLGIPLPSGGGKKNIINLFFSLFKEKQKDEIVKPTSYHPEQLVGKVIRHGKKDPTYEELKGHLSQDLVIIDEAIDLLRSTRDKYRESRSYLNEALDPYGHNRITKRMTDLPKEETLSYMPDCNVSLFFQPFSVDEEVVLVGTFRRFLIPYSNFSPQIQIGGYEERVRGNKNIEFAEALTEINKRIERVKEISKGKDFLSVDDSAIDRFIELHLELTYQGFAHSDKGKNYTRLIDYTLQDILLKMAGIQALVHDHDKIRKEDIEKAYIDLADLYAGTLEYIYHKVVGYLDYGDNWAGARKDDQKCLRWLSNKEALSKERTQVSIKEYIGAIMEICDIKEESARKRYYKHKENKWVDSEQIGQHDSKIWLTLERKNKKESKSVKQFRKDVFKDPEYFKLIEKYQSQGGKGGKGGNPLGKKNQGKNLSPSGTTLDTLDTLKENKEKLKDKDNSLTKNEKLIYDFIQSYDGNSVDLKSIHNMIDWDQSNKEPEKHEISETLGSLTQKRESIKKDSNSGYYYQSDSQSQDRNKSRPEKSKRPDWLDYGFEEHEKSIKGELNG